MKIHRVFVSLCFSMVVTPVAFALDMNDTPFLSEHSKEMVEKDYNRSSQKCRSSYAVAISKSGSWGSYCHAKLSTKEITRIVLEKCEHSVLEACGLVVVAGRLVEFQESTQNIRYPETFDASVVPFVSANSRNRLKKKYYSAPVHKALALTGNGRFAYYTGRSSDTEAKEMALERCEKYDKQKNRCFLYAVGQKVVFDIFTNIFPER